MVRSKLAFISMSTQFYSSVDMVDFSKCCVFWFIIMNSFYVQRMVRFNQIAIRANP